MFNYLFDSVSRIFTVIPPQKEEERKNFFVEIPIDICLLILRKLFVRDLASFNLTCRWAVGIASNENLPCVSLAKSFFNTMKALPSTYFTETYNINKFNEHPAKIMGLSVSLQLVRGEAADFYVQRRFKDVTNERRTSYFKGGFFTRLFELQSVHFAGIKDNLPPRCKISLMAGLKELNAFYAKK